MYEIKVLSNKDFESVSKSDPRYSYVDDTNMGFADREKGVAYVRGTNIHDLNKYLISHELEELESAESTHEDPNGIRHKKFFKEIFAPFIAPVLAAFVPGIGPALAPAVGAIGSSIASKSRGQQGEGGISIPQQQQPSGLSDFTPFSSGALGGFSTSESASQRVPESVTKNLASSLNQNTGFSNNQQLSPEILQRLKGNYGGRFVF